MNKGLKIAINIAIFLLIFGFVWYMVASAGRDNSQRGRNAGEAAEPFDSPYVQIASFELPEEINRFDLYDNKLFIAAGQSLFILATDGNLVGKFPIGADLRDVVVSDNEIYVLYPTRIAVFSIDGQPVRNWDACSYLSDYCSFAVYGNAVFVTDAANKEIVKYTTEGLFEGFVRSPIGFIIPSYSFDIDVWNDTVYVANSGRHIIEKYTLDGDYISSWGGPGVDAGLFAGCCNPVYMSFSPDGTLITSEKGNPRISNFDRNGNLNAVWLNNRMLGGSNKAREVRAMGDKLFIAINERIIVFETK